MASIEPTERSICRATITKTMPQAMIATGTVCTAMLNTLRGPTKVPPVQIVKTSATAAKAISMPSNRTSISSVSITLRRGPAPWAESP